MARPNAHERQGRAQHDQKEQLAEIVYQAKPYSRKCKKAVRLGQAQA